MMHLFHARFRLFSAVVLLLAVCGFPSLAGAADLSYAGVVVRQDDGRMSYAYVGFTETEINGIELLRRTGLDVVTVSFGGLGEGVCSIDATGCPSTECRQRVCQGPTEDDPFWQYFRQASPGDWQALALGASSTKVRDGDVDGWSWTPLDAGLPALDLEEVANLAGYDWKSFDSVSPGEPGSVLHRESAVDEDDAQSTAIYLTGAAILLAAVVLVAVLASRRRRHVRRA
jgi:uncharacterized protein (TIGR03382 family)